MVAASPFGAVTLVAASRFGAVTLVNQSANSERPEEPAALTAGFFVSGVHSTLEDPWDPALDL